MGKRFVGKPCAYCPSVSATGDHIFARAFFPKSQWPGLPQVPACRKCNGFKSALETELAAVLLFGGRHGDALQNLENMAPRRLAKNRRLLNSIRAGLTSTWAPSATGLFVPTMAVPIDDRKLTLLFEYIIRGLVRFEFDETLGPDDHIEVLTLTVIAGEPMFRRFLNLNAAARTKRSIGNGAFVYEGSQATDNSHITVWLLSAFGGLLFGDERGVTHETRIGALTGPKRISDRVTLRQKWLEGRGPFAL